VNHRRPWWLIFSLLPPLIALGALFIPSGCGSGGGSAPTAVGTPAEVSVALIGVPPVGNFRSVLLNVSGIRINKRVNASTSSPGWTTIAVPSSAGTGNAQNPGDLQIDLMNTQTGPVVFNTAGVEPGAYNTLQVLIDSTNPGTVVPACQTGLSTTEGCINYPLTLDTTTNPNGNLLGIVLPLATPLSVAANQTSPIVIQLQVSILGQPANVTDPYEASITAEEVNFSSYLGTVTGTVTVSGTASQFHLSPLLVSAEITGTNDVVESVPIRKGGVYTLELPAAPSGTSYDIFVGGAAVEYKGVQGLTLIPGQFVGGEDFKVTQSNPGKFDGIIADACTGLGIPGAQIEVLAPATELATPRPTPPASFCFDHPEQCVVVAQASADQNGSYPIPGTTKNPNGLSEVPLAQPDLALRVSASGYSQIISSAFIRSLSTNQVCSASTSPTVCSFSLPTGYLKGTVNLVTAPPPGSSTYVQVFAENSGTNQLVSALTQPLVFLPSQSSQPFTLNVPINDPANSFDLYAVAIDPYEGGPDPYPGHDIPVLANQPAPTGCNPPVNLPGFQPMNCVGHGSITGTVSNPDLGAAVEVEKLDPSNNPVQILGTSPGLFSSNIPRNNAYTLCVPPDSYLLQRFEAPSPEPGVPTPIPTAVGSPQNVVVPVPAPTLSPCPSTCSNSSAGGQPCPGICTGTAASPL
jgi:hypothetical protein